MNPIHWIRWKVLIALVAVTGGLAFFGIGPVAQSALNRIGAGGYGASWNVQDVCFNPAAGRLTLSSLNVDNERQGSSVNQASAHSQKADSSRPDHMLTAQSITFDMDMLEL